MASVCPATSAARAVEKRRAAVRKRPFSRAKALFLIAGRINRKIARRRLIVTRTKCRSPAGSLVDFLMRSTAFLTKLSQCMHPGLVHALTEADQNSEGVSERPLRKTFVLKY